MTEESCTSRPSLAVFTQKAPKRVNDNCLTKLCKKDYDDPTMLTGQSSIISESGNVDGNSFVEGNRIKLPESKITKASQKNAFFDKKLKPKAVVEYKQIGKKANKRAPSSNDSTPQASVVCSLPLSALGGHSQGNFKQQIEAVAKGDLFGLSRLGVIEETKVTALMIKAIECNQP